MPFQSEKQRRYLWANEPEIARDWTNTYGHRIKKDNGGIMHRFENYANEDGGNISVPRSFQARPYSEQVNLAYITPQEEGVLQRLRPGTPHRGPMEVPNYDSYDPRGGYATSEQLDRPTAGDIQAGVGSGGAGAGGERTHIAPLSTTVAPGQTVSAAEAWKTAQPAQRDYRAANDLAWQNRQAAWNLREPYRQSTSYYKPRKGIGGFFKGLGKGIGNLAMMFNPWTAGLGIMGNPKMAAFLNLMGRGKDKLGGGISELGKHKTLADYFNRNKRPRVDDETRLAIMQDPDQEIDIMKDFRRRNPLDLTPDYMHDLEAKAPVDPASIYMDESVPINKGNDFPSDEEIVNQRRYAGIRDMSVNQIQRHRVLDMQNKLWEGNEIGNPLTPEEKQELNDLIKLRKSGMTSSTGTAIV